MFLQKWQCDMDMCWTCVMDMSAIRTLAKLSYYESVLGTTIIIGKNPITLKRNVKSTQNHIVYYENFADVSPVSPRIIIEKKYNY